MDIDNSGQVFEVKPIFEKEESPFTDIDNTVWSYEAIKKITELKLLVPFKTEYGIEFKPKQNVTREELAIALYKMLQLIENKKV